MSRVVLISSILGCVLVSGIAFLLGKNQAAKGNPAVSNPEGSARSDFRLRKKTRRMLTAEPSPEKGKRRLIMKNVVHTDASLPPLDQRSLHTLLTEMASMMDDSSSGFDINRMLRIMGMNNYLGPDDIPAALKFAEGLNKRRQQQTLNQAILKRWAEFDGEAAMKHATSNLSKDELDSVTGEILRGWASGDPLGAYQWLKDEEEARKEEPDHEYAFRSWHWSSVFSGLAAENIEFAWEEMRGLAEKSDRNAAMRGIAQSGMMEVEAQDDIWNRLSALDDESERRDGQRFLVQQVAQMDPQRAAGLVTQLEESSARNDLVQSVAAAWMMSEITEAGDWMLENTPEESHSEAVSNAVRQRAFMDPEGTVEWLDAIGDRVDTQPATISLIDNVAQMDPPRAWSYIDRIEDDSARLRAMRTTYDNWSNRNQEAADAALAEAGITLEQLRQSALPARIEESTAPIEEPTAPDPPFAGAAFRPWSPECA